MSNRVVCSLSIAILLGTAAVMYHCSRLWAVGSVLTLYLVWVHKKRKKKFPILPILFAVCICFGSLHGHICIRNREFYVSHLPDGAECCLQGRIYKKEEKTLSYNYYLKNCIIQCQGSKYRCRQILVYLNTDEYSIGKTLIVKGKIKQFSLPKNEGNYDERQYYHSLNVEFAIEEAAVTKCYGKENQIAEYLCLLRDKMTQSYKSCMHSEDAGVLVAMTLGDKNFMDTEVKEMYQKNGISHFYSVSGLHVGMLGMAFYRLLRRGRFSYGMSGILSGIWIMLYGMLTGFGISATRAIGMFLLAIYAKARGRCVDGFTSLGILAVFMVWDNPYVLYNVGFLLSYGAVVGVYVAQEVLEKENVPSTEEKWFHKRLANIRETFVVSLCIQLLTIPILANSFYEISIYSIFVNLFILPCMGVLFGCGLLGGMAGCFKRWIGIVFLVPCHCILWLFEMVCGIFSKLPYAVWITGKFEVWKLVVWYVVLVVFLWVRWKLKIEKKKGVKGIAVSTAAKENIKIRQVTCQGICERVPVILAGIIWVTLLIHVPASETEINFLDVGQGDGICIQNEDGTTMFIDGGSSDVSKVGVYRILPYLKYNGIRRVDYWFVSHLDTDHMSGLQEVMEADYRIDTLVLSKNCPRDDSYYSLLALAEEKGIDVAYMDKGQALKSVDGKGKILWQMQCLFPRKEDEKMEVIDKNALSLTLLYESDDFKAFFGGDIGMEQEKILAEECKLPRVAVFKVLHHGSKNSNSTELLEEIKPKVSVVSCGQENLYGHPHADAIERIESVGSEVLYTMESGQITVKLDEGKMKLVEFIQKDANEGEKAY